MSSLHFVITLCQHDKAITILTVSRAVSADVQHMLNKGNKPPVLSGPQITRSEVDISNGMISQNTFRREHLRLNKILGHNIGGSFERGKIFLWRK